MKMVKRIRKAVGKRFRKGKRHLRKFWRSFDRNVIFPVGENCLADRILGRYGLKSFSSPCSSGRSNIEYVLAFEKEEFRDFLNPEFLRYGFFEGRKAVQNRKYVEVSNAYRPSVTNGFELPHHDVIGDRRQYKALKRRCERLTHLKHRNVIMLYYHGLCAETDMRLLVSHIVQLEEIYRNRGNTVHAFVFSQVIVPDRRDRKMEKETVDGVHLYRFYTNREWSNGSDDNDPDLFWAVCDDDLLAGMADDIRRCRI